MPPDAWIGQVLQGRYRIVARLAEGGMGVVYKGERVGLDRPVAIKFLHAFASGDADALRRFEIEAKAASRLNHPNCVSVIDFGVEKREPYLVMEFIEGRTLRGVIEAGPLELARACALARQVLAGLAHAHGHKIIHRDIKPENILVFSDALGEHARITDFGLAKLTDASTITDELAIGTPSYMSPEQTLGKRADARSDVYGAGIVLFELLTGKKPFTGTTPFETMKQHREAPIPAFADVAPDRDAPAAIEAVVNRALAKDPDERYPSAIELASALDNTTTFRTPSPHDTTGAMLAKAKARPRWLIAAVVAGLAALAVAIGVLATRGDEAHGHPATEIPDAATPLPEVTDALARGGDPGQRIATLDAIRTKHPTNAHISYVLGNLNVERSWWQLAVESYADAIRKHAPYRSDPRLVRDVVQALQSDRAFEEASELITNVLGSAAIAELTAAERSGSPALRSRAKQILLRIARGSAGH